MLNVRCCFYCKYYYHINPDDDGCRFYGEKVYFDQPACFRFTVQEAEDLITDNFNDKTRL